MPRCQLPFTLIRPDITNCQRHFTIMFHVKQSLFFEKCFTWNNIESLARLLYMENLIFSF